MRYNSVHPEVKLIEKAYLKGVSLSKDEMKHYEEKIFRMERLEKWSVDIAVRSDYPYDAFAIPA